MFVDPWDMGAFSMEDVRAYLPINQVLQVASTKAFLAQQ
jgi:hypothetical protein